MKRTRFFLLALLVTTALNLYSQELDSAEAEPPAQNGLPEQPSPRREEKIYVIVDFEFEIRGRTRPFAIINNAELKRGEEIRGDANLQAYISDKTQMLINQRVLKNNAEIRYSVGEQQEDGMYPVILTIKTDDSWNIIALPQPSYSSNSGFELTIKARDYNFLGTMNPLRVDLGYNYDENYRSSFNFEIDSSTPFRVFDYNWTFKFVNLFSYRPNVEEPYYYRNVTGLSVELPFDATTFTLGFEEALTLNEENSDSDKLSTGQGVYPDFQNGMYMRTNMYGSWKIPIGYSADKYGEIAYTPSLSLYSYHELPGWPLQENRRGPSLNFSHSIGFGRIDWQSNFREGLSASINNSFSYNFHNYRINSEPLSISFSFNGIGHFIVSKFFGISSRLQYRHWYAKDSTYHDNAGDNLRGILDKTIWADYMLSLNMDFPFRILKFIPSTWFNNRKFRFFDFEVHASPIIDMAVYHNPTTDESAIPKNTAFSGGLEVIIFSDFIRRFYLRGSIGVNIKELFRTKRIPDGDNREISITMGHYF